MRQSHLFLAASFGCLALAAVAFAAPQALVLYRGNNAKAVAQCTRLLKTYHDTGDWPDAAAPDYIRYDECYYLICGGTKPEA
ncbi:hypothetical protein [Mesorhizobium sp.]|uniref:hypothetical protein n=1 Tax=Mesorhizobium sp. TaxID=1871066 RepID=UPI000FE6FA74|nr:hypothetical protein [Mesorhizobium sp.]RWD70048.1 MAG: hypothetical protein EOS37_16090 [Mesorhizobium sp.]TIV56521.1 MAG: hypothetical protein E5V80_26580 [Mesorhizobium sp.]TIV73950.1 MAG: hypothetical protein E5V93_17200 [Mesorhizobium sp.]